MFIFLNLALFKVFLLIKILIIFLRSMKKLTNMSNFIFFNILIKLEQSAKHYTTLLEFFISEKFFKLKMQTLIQTECMI
jgi:hypothetical protein